MWQGFEEALGIAIAETLKPLRGQTDAGARGRIFKNPFVGPPGHLDAVERFRDAEQLFERAIHRAAARASCANQCSIDVEQNDRHSVRTFPARGPLGEVSSSNSTRCPSAS
jgi:hypothetical protein